MGIVYGDEVREIFNLHQTNQKLLQENNELKQQNTALQMQLNKMSKLFQDREFSYWDRNLDIMNK
jgi:hypothetical protein